MKVLFVNACMRGEDKSRTYRLSMSFLAEILKTADNPELETADLTQGGILLTGSDIDRRAELCKRGIFSDQLFKEALSFAEADMIVVGAPYWDLSFPASLKAYFERISVAGIAFEYTETGSCGLCRAKRLVYITTAGGFICANDFGTEYIKGLCSLYGIPEFHSLKAEGLDIAGMDTPGIMQKATKQAKALAFSLSRKA